MRRRVVHFLNHISADLKELGKIGVKKIQQVIEPWRAHGNDFGLDRDRFRLYGREREQGPRIVGIHLHALALEHSFQGLPDERFRERIVQIKHHIPPTGAEQ
jgi:hypothetical protein